MIPRPEHESDEAVYARERLALVSALGAEGIRDAEVLAAIARVHRHEFVPARSRGQAYHDQPLAIGNEQTISQPFIVALMTELARVQPGARVLVVGTGSGYQDAVLAELGAEVYSIEVIESLADEARARLARLGYDVHLRVGDGHAGWPEAAPFQAIVVTAAPRRVPAALEQQLADGGRLVIPVGDGSAQRLKVLIRRGDRCECEDIVPVRFVPMVSS